jgi:orotidine-5'-phosphate decarboxylase
MFVAGATHPEKFARVRFAAPEYFLLVPGIGAQGGDFEMVCREGMNQSIGLLVNSSREIIYAGSGQDFAEKAREAAQKIQQQMAQVLHTFLR